MAHIPQAKQSAVLDQFLGLVTNAGPETLPEGAAPLCWDCDFVTGSVFTRAGLVSSYTLTAGVGWGLNWGGYYG